jgi:hypothetical protein
MSVVFQLQSTRSTVEIFTRLRTDLEQYNSIVIRKRVTRGTAVL